MARRTNHEAWKGALAGLVGGLVASWTMNQSQKLLSKLAESRHSDGQHKQQESQQSQQGGMDKPATLMLAEKLSHGVLHRELRPDEEKIAEPLVHYAYGTGWGGIYGALSTVKPVTSTGVGLPFGAALWLAGDEIAVPALGLSKGPKEYPISSHLQALATHCVYGVTTEAVRRVLLKALD